jgi:hypothetical protein
MANLTDALLRPDVFPHVVADVKVLVQQLIDDKGAITGAPLKLAFKAVTSFAPGYYDGALNNLVPAFVDKLEPYWVNFSAAGGGDFGGYLDSRSEQVSNSLLSITDEAAQNSDRGAVVAAYKSVRGGAQKNIETALPALGALVQKYAY